MFKYCRSIQIWERDHLGGGDKTNLTQMYEVYGKSSEIVYVRGEVKVENHHQCVHEGRFLRRGSISPLWRIGFDSVPSMKGSCISKKKNGTLHIFTLFSFFFFCFFFHFYSKLIFSRLIVNLSYNWMENLSKKGNICAKRMFSTFRSSKSQSQVPWKGSSIGVSRVTRRRQLSPNAVRWVVAQRLCPTRQPRIRLMSGKEGHP